MIVLRWKKIIVLAVAVVAIVSLSVGAYGIAAAVTHPKPFATIVLDAGHGGWDGGVVSHEGHKEADINLSIVFALRSELERRGIEVVLTRNCDKALGDDKRSDMKARADIIKQANPSAVISVHVNKYSQSSRRGIQVFYDDTGYGKGFALTMQSVLNTYINDKYCKRQFSALGGDYYITKCADNVPSIIVECGFISNAEDLNLLKSDGYRRELAVHMADAVLSCVSDEVSTVTE